MQVSLTNPSGALPVSVVVNGKSYNCSGSTNANKIYVEIVNEAQFEGGDTELTIEKVNMTLDGDDYSINPIRCINYGEIIGHLEGVGGIAGGGGIIEESCNKGVIDAASASMVGGIVGNGCKLVHCFNTGKITGDYWTAGLSGANSEVNSCLSIGDVFCNWGGSGTAENNEWSPISNSYCLIPIIESDSVCSIEELNMIDFYTKILNWDKNIWDFSDLDVENGKYPTLK